MKPLILSAILFLVVHFAVAQGGQNSRSSGDLLLASRLDLYDTTTGVWEIGDSSIYQYNAQREDTIWEGKTPSGALTQRTVYKYDANGNQIYALQQIFNSNVDSLDNYVFFTSKYDANNNRISYLYESWNLTTNVWDTVSLTTDVYDNNHRILVEDDYGWDNTIQNWDTGSQTLNFYYTGGDSTIKQYWAPGYWVNTWKYIDEYSGTELVSDSIVEWDGDHWQNNSCDSYAYDTSGNNTLALSFRYTTNPDLWSAYERDTFTYDNRHDLLSEVVQTWWEQYVYRYENYSESVSIFDSLGNKLENTHYAANDYPDTAFYPTSRDLYTYDAHNNCIFAMYQQYNTGAQYFYDDERYYWWYNFTSIGIDEIKNDLQATLFPNPAHGATGHIRFSMDEASTVLLNVYDMTGHLTASQNRLVHSGTNDLVISLPLLAPGNYLVQLFDPISGNGSVLQWVRQ